jgi:hypothetical protein
MKRSFGIVFLALCSSAGGQTYFNAWLSSCAHLIGPTGNVKTLQLALEQSRGMSPPSPAISWDLMLDVGDWTASQEPPTDEDGEALASFLNRAFGEQRGRYFTVSGNHDGEPKGWQPGEFALKYVNPLGAAEYAGSSGFRAAQRPDSDGVRQLLSYPGTRWDRYLVRTGNVIWIMLGDRNEFDTLAEARGDTSGLFQAGRGSAAGMPRGGYPSGSVTRDTFDWWRAVVENPMFGQDILITAHHLMPGHTTISTDDGEPGNFHGAHGSVGPNGQIGGQLYWLREYDDSGREIRQYAQTRPFLDYLRDHPGAIAAWIGGHTHVNSPEETINGRGIYVRKHDVTFLSIGALTGSHAGGANQMTRLLTFQDGSDEAIVNVYIHSSKKKQPAGWHAPAARRVPLGKAFRCPPSSSNTPSPTRGGGIAIVPEAPADPAGPRYYWDLDERRSYDFNNETHVIGADGSPYGEFQNLALRPYSDDSPFKGGRSLDFRGTNGRVEFSAPYQPAMTWPAMTLSCWLKTALAVPQEAVSYSSANGVGKFRLWYDGSAWIFEVAEGEVWRSARWERRPSKVAPRWQHFVGIIDGGAQRIRLYVDGTLQAEAEWLGARLKKVSGHRFVIGASGEPFVPGGKVTWSRPFDGLIDEVMIFDSVVDPNKVRSLGVLR